MLVRNILAVISLCTVAVKAAEFYRNHVHGPLSEMMTEAADAEYARREKEAFRDRPQEPPSP